MSADGHETRTEQAPGYWANLVRCACECGFQGPIRNLDDADRMRHVVIRDGHEHRRNVGAGPDEATP